RQGRETRMRSADDAEGLLAGGGGATAPTPALDSPYWRFYEQVAAAQLTEWSAGAPKRVLDVSGRTRFAAQLAGDGHDVIHVCGPTGTAPPGVTVVRADARTLGWV